MNRKESIYLSVFRKKTEENKAIVKWRRFSNYSMLVKTVAYKQRALSKNKSATLVFSIEGREKAKAIIFRLTQREKFGGELKYLKLEK